MLEDRARETHGVRLERRSREGGFTLIELLIVIVVLGILSGIVVFSLGGISKQSATAACNSDAKSVETAVAAYQAQNNGDNPPAVGTSGAQTNGDTPAWWPPYLKSWPGSNHSYYQISTDSSGNVDVTVGSSTNQYNDNSPSACNVAS